MVVSNLNGGIGNNLFQIACGYSLAKRNNVDFSANLFTLKLFHTKYTAYTHNLFRNVNLINKQIPNNKYIYNSLTYKEVEFKKDIVLEGYYQSEKYFNNSEEIINLFDIDTDTYNYIKNKYNYIKEDNTCSIHVRRGDFLNIPFYNKLDVDYYKKSMDLIGNDCLFLIFSDDIEWCKNNFNNKNIIFIQNEKDYVDLYLMSLCKNNITANSTFSWWGAYLNKNKDKKVITPKLWFNDIHSNDDLTPNNWIKI